jgi:ribosome-associated protein
MLRGRGPAAEEPLKKVTDPSAEPDPLESQRETRLEPHLEKAARVLAAGLERNAQMPVVMDIRAVTSFADAFVLLSGRSDRQVRAIADGIVEALNTAGDEPLGVEGMDEGRWVLIDCNDVVVHVFDPETRDLYALERLWSDAAPVELTALGLEPAAIEAAGATGETRTRARRSDGV